MVLEALVSDFAATATPPPLPFPVDKDCVEAETVTLLLEADDVEADSVEVAFSFLVEVFCLAEWSPALFEELDWDELSAVDVFFLMDFFEMTATE